MGQVITAKLNNDIHKTLDWLGGAFDDTTLEMNYSMFPFLLSLGEPKEKKYSRFINFTTQDTSTQVWSDHPPSN